jgi:hypothetical protein
MAAIMLAAIQLLDSRRAGIARPVPVIAMGVSSAMPMPSGSL